MPDPADDETQTLSAKADPKPQATTGTAPSPYGSGTILAGHDDAPGTSPASFHIPGYTITGELARGGMGAVYLARDTELLRDVAIKVLQDRFDTSGDVAARFDEEARITGQLQHPGIPPVHKLGRLLDGRPFMVMKLIKGRTLSDLIEAPDAPSQPQRIQIFEQICQTVAFAHVRRVIHRDLKPSNVMVGAFGEVQVMDWGLAKVLGETAPEPRLIDSATATLSVIVPNRTPDSATQVGSIMGTPAYMPPEQAKGEVHRTDCRADVFSLGAILCELLTGEPPYTGEYIEVKLKAALGEVGPAFERLDACEADADLIALAKSCLAKDVSDRPNDAAELAAAVADHRTGVETRLRAAEVEQAAAAVRAGELRKRRRVLTAFAAAVALALIGGVWKWRDLRADRDARRAAAAQAAELAVAKADQLRTQAGAIGSATVPRSEASAAVWAQAVAVMDQAHEALAAGDPEPATVNRVGQVRSEISAGHRRALDRQEAAEKEAKFLNTLSHARTRANEVRTVIREKSDAKLKELGTEQVKMPKEEPAPPIEVTGGNREKLAEGYGRAFKILAIDVDRGNTDDVANQLRALPAGDVRTHAILALHFWRKEVAEPSPAVAARLDGLIDKVDADPWRARYRAALRAKDAAALTKLVDEADAQSLAPDAYLLLGDAADVIGAAGKEKLKERIYLRGHDYYPDDTWINERLGDFYYPDDPDKLADNRDRVQKALGYYRAALVHRTGSVQLRSSIAYCLPEAEGLEWIRHNLEAFPDQPDLYTARATLLEKSDRPAAVAAYRKVVELEPNDYANVERLASALKQVGDTAGAAAAWQKYAEAHPFETTGHTYLGKLLYESQQYDRALSAFRTAALLKPEDIAIQTWIGNIRDELGVKTAAVDGFKAFTAAFPKNPDGFRALGQAQREAYDFVAAVKSCRTAVELSPTFANVDALAEANFSCGHYDEAVSVLTRYVANNPKDAAGFRSLSGMVSRRADRVAECEAARRAYELEPTATHAELLATALTTAGDRNAAIRLLRAFTEKNPRDADGFRNLGNALQKSDPATAQAAFRKAVTLFPDEKNTQLLAEFLYELGDEAGALSAAAEYAAHTPRLPEGHHFLGDLLQRVGRLDEATAAFRRSAEVEPAEAYRWSVLAECLFENGDPAAAEKVLRDFAARFPADSGGHGNLASIRKRRGDTAGAIAAYRDAARLEPSNPFYHSILSDIFLDAGDTFEGYAVRKSFSAKYPTVAESWWSTGENVSPAAEVARLRKEVEVAPTFSHYHSLALALARNKDLQAAIETMRAYLKRQPKDASGHTALGRLYEDAKDWKRAIDAYRTAIELEPNANSWYPLANALDQEGDTDGAIAELRNAVRANPYDQTSYSILSYHFKKNGSPFAALAAAEQGARTNPHFLTNPRAGYRYDAACFAVLASYPTAYDTPKDANRAALRAKAYDWLSADLQYWRSRPNSPRGRSDVRERFTAWLTDDDLLYVRHPMTVAFFPTEERDRWRHFWYEVRKLRDDSTPKEFVGPPKPGT